MKIYFDGYEYGELGLPELYSVLIPRLKPTMKALDLGCSEGHIASPVVLAVGSMVGVDINLPALNVASRHFAMTDYLGKFVGVYSDAAAFLEANSEKFDVITMSDFLMFLPKTKGVNIIKASYETLAPGGLIWIVTMSSSDSWYPELVDLQEPIDTDTFESYSHCMGVMPICFYRPGELDELIKSMGGEVLYSAEKDNDRGAIVHIFLGQKPK